MTVRAALIAAVVTSVLAVAGCGSGGTGTGTGTGSAVTTAPSTAAPATTSTGPEPTACREGPAPDPGRKASYSKAETVLKPGTGYTIVMTTSCGTLKIALDPKAGGDIPNSIAFLAGKGFYDNLTFHRVVPDFVLQGGDPQGDGTGGPGYQVVGPVPEGYQYKLGDVAMAKTQDDPPGAAGSQFFVVSGEQGEQILTSQPVYGILGHANDPVSLATIARIAALAVGDGAPSKPVWIISAKVTP